MLHQLELMGIKPSSVKSNLTQEEWRNEELNRNEGRLSSNGTVIINTGIYTGRSPNDRFIVDEKGAVVDPKLIRKLGAGCDEEALRALEKLKFNPGYVQGKPVKARFTLPIRFAL